MQQPSSTASQRKPIAPIHAWEHPPLKNEHSKVDFLCTEQGDVWILHDRPLPDLVKWVEYDGDSQKVILVMQDGRSQDLGFPVPTAMGDLLQRTARISIMLIEQGQMTDMALVPITVRQSIFG